MNEKKMLNENFKECILTMINKDENVDKFGITKEEKQHWLSIYEDTVESRIYLDFKKWLKEHILAIKNDEINKAEKELNELKNKVKDIENINLDADLW